MQFVYQSTHSLMNYTLKTPHLIVLSLLPQRAAEEEERETGTGMLLAYHISLSFSPEVGQLLVCIHTAGHHIATLQFSGQFELTAICSTDGISVLVGTNVSEHWF